MTVIAGKVEGHKVVMAADTQVTSGWQNKEPIDGSKLIVSDKLIIGGTGWHSDLNYMSLFLEAHRPASSSKRDLIEFFAEFYAYMKVRKTDFKPYNYWLLAIDGKLFSVSSDLAVREHLHFAVGSGADFANAALHLGKDPKEAVQVACDLTIYCSAPIHVETLSA